MAYANPAAVERTRQHVPSCTAQIDSIRWRSVTEAGRQCVLGTIVLFAELEVAVQMAIDFPGRSTSFDALLGVAQMCLQQTRGSRVSALRALHMLLLPDI